jgi:hypothetical protein
MQRFRSNFEQADLRHSDGYVSVGDRSSAQRSEVRRRGVAIDDAIASIQQARYAVLDAVAGRVEAEQAQRA